MKGGAFLVVGIGVGAAALLLAGTSKAQTSPRPAPAPVPQPPAPLPPLPGILPVPIPTPGVPAAAPLDIPAILPPPPPPSVLNAPLPGELGTGPAIAIPPVLAMSLATGTLYQFTVSYSPNIAAQDAMSALAADGWQLQHFTPITPGDPLTGLVPATAAVAATWNGSQGQDPMALTGGGKYKLMGPPLVVPPAVMS